MTASHLELSIALSDNERTRPLLEGRVAPQGIKLVPTMVHPSEMFWRQLRFAEFDVSEMSMSSLIISTARGDTRWVAIPVFTMRKFFYTSIIVRTDSGIALRSLSLNAASPALLSMSSAIRASTVWAAMMRQAVTGSV